jgi:hypothetical protein
MASETKNTFSTTLQERNEQTLANIQNLQVTEQNLYEDLEKNTLSTDEKKSIVVKINEISQMRLNLYETLKDIYESYGTNLTNSESLAKQQMIAVEIVEKELNAAKVRMNAINLEKNNALRMVEINTYYGKQYSAQAKLMRTIAIGCIPIVIFSILANKGILSAKIYGFIISIILVIIILMVGRQWLDMNNRDDMNYDEYNWYFNPSTAPSSTGTAVGSNDNNIWTNTQTKTCVGAECCFEGSKFDEKINMCVN